jgi:DNA-binding transcriptional MerR regulator
MTASAEAADLDEGRWCYRMKDLCDATGLPRQAIHFYIQQGLLPSGRKTGRNMAWYTEEHLERLHLIKKLQHERFLPLKAIKALFDGEDGVFSPRQHAFLAGVKERLAESLKTSEDRSPTLTPAEIGPRRRRARVRARLGRWRPVGRLASNRSGRRLDLRSVWEDPFFGLYTGPRLWGRRYGALSGRHHQAPQR